MRKRKTGRPSGDTSPKLKKAAKCQHGAFVRGRCVDCGMPIGTAARQGQIPTETKKRPPTRGTGFDIDM